MRSFFMVCLALLIGVFTAQAHPNLQNALWVQCEPSLVHVAVNVSLKELTVAHEMALGSDSRKNAEAINRAAEAHGDYVLKHLTVSIGTKALQGKLVGVTLPNRIAQPEATFYQYELEYPFSGSAPGEVTLAHNMLAEWPYAAGTAWNVSYVVRTKRSDSDEVRSWLLNSGQPTVIAMGLDTIVAPADAKADDWRTFRDYLWHGVRHILTGYDHLLFVAALVIATLSFWEMAKVILAFTLAHTVTLTLCVFGIFRLPAFIVEPLIALSIIFVALENVLRPQRAHSRARLAVAFGFGLIHGLGFAGGLLDAMAGLPALGIWIALAAFSLGVEIGHQAVVLPLFSALKISRRKLREGWHPALLRYGSAAISCGGVYFLVVALRQQFLSH